MRLLNTHNLQFTDFRGEAKVPYAILSHQWGAESDEVSYKDYKKKLKRESAGYKKISGFCTLARKDGLNWAWIDTCCIDKRSSAELTQSINSMFAWYGKAHTCYVYLKDVGPQKNWRESGWWQRGWTLQELIASPNVIFCDQHWHKFGTKAEMAKQIEMITGIPSAVLLDESKSMRYCIAQRMSWAVGRTTTWIEDKAYSLMGLFRINMPLLCGEGERAFQRLQLAILQKYPDESILAWLPRGTGPHGVLARSPDDFDGCAKIIPNDARLQPSQHQLDPDPRRENPPRVTSWGIEIRANARRLEPRKRTIEFEQVQRFLWALTLTIAWNGRMQELPCTIILVRSGPAPYTYQRYGCYHANSVALLNNLNKRYVVGQIEADKLFYLQFDEDIDV